MAVTGKQHRRKTVKRQELILLTPAQVAEMIGYSESALKLWRLTGTGPRFIRPTVGGRPRYRLVDIEQWLAQREEGNAA